MAEFKDSRRCHYFFVYDGSKVRGEGDPTRDGICYFYPEETALEVQELLCGQLAGASRCVSELSSSPVRRLRLRSLRFAIHMKDDFFWALGYSMDVPIVSVCQLLDQLINLFCFYNGAIRQSYQIHSRDILAARWARYLHHLQARSSELHHIIFSSLRTLDSTNVDPLLLLKAALILQACQRCPLVLAGCIIFRGRVVSTQFSPDLTMKVMVHESETHDEALCSDGGGAAGLPLSAVSSVSVFLTSSELQCLKAYPVDPQHRFGCSTPNKESVPAKTRLSRTLSDTPFYDSDSAHSPPASRKVSLGLYSSASHSPTFSPVPSQSAVSAVDSPQQSLKPVFPNGHVQCEDETEARDESNCHSLDSSAEGCSQTHTEGNGSVTDLSEDDITASGPALDLGADEAGVEGDGSPRGHRLEARDGCSSVSEQAKENPLIPMKLYLHQVQALVLVLLVEPSFFNDTVSMEEVYHSSLASLNGLEAHLRTAGPGAPGSHGPYVFAHFDCVQSVLTSNLSAGAGGVQERSFVRAVSLLHSHFCNTESLQEAIVRNAGVAVYGTRSVAQQTFFMHDGGSIRNSGIPNHQDSAFSLPSKARHRLLKHGLNLL
ncbi:Hermansky-Pudlak syndrome 4 protein [Thalassophryne amazonica]|uniref:Hermansky-Pudlak syndrome 4 protein n=1 Tax=Thalassophryne amazonica TaxID=390379 RepID=UPI0014715014|nr:Hermansky-Pudlak syndrome 4 protein [Thalassophryne amazonica]